MNLNKRKEQMYAFLMATHRHHLGAESPAKVLPKELFSYLWEFVKPTIEEADNYFEIRKIYNEETDNLGENSENIHHLFFLSRLARSSFALASFGGQPSLSIFLSISTHLRSWR